ncbi:MAG TPA: sulfotransferase [Caulobacteraceae bacterium]|nr:sulfotransferase [Caulobacteraceae bacterium]
MTLEIVGAGLGRTGTMSLKLALEQLGFGPCYHMIEVFQHAQTAIPLWEEVGDGKPPQWDKIFEGYRATVDWPSATYYKELAAHYPKAKVILSKRDPEAWWRSTQATIFNPARVMSAQMTDFTRMVQKTVGVMFDGQMNDHDRLISVYNRHNAEVVRVIAPGRLLVWEPGEGWPPLCRFLGVAVPEGPMPHANSTQEFQGRLCQMVDTATGVSK